MSDQVNHPPIGIRFTGFAGLQPTSSPNTRTAGSVLTLFSPERHYLTRNGAVEIPLKIALRFPEEFFGVLITSYEMTSKNVHLDTKVLEQDEDIVIKLENRGNSFVQIHWYDAVAELILLPLEAPLVVQVSQPRDTTHIDGNKTEQTQLEGEVKEVKRGVSPVGLPPSNVLIKNELPTSLETMAQGLYGTIINISSAVGSVKVEIKQEQNLEEPKPGPSEPVAGPSNSLGPPPSSLEDDKRGIVKSESPPWTPSWFPEDTKWGLEHLLSSSPPDDDDCYIDEMQTSIRLAASNLHNELINNELPASDTDSVQSIQY